MSSAVPDVMIASADERSLGQILQDAYKGKVQLSQAEQLAHAVAEQKTKVRDNVKAKCK